MSNPDKLDQLGTQLAALKSDQRFSRWLLIIGVLTLVVLAVYQVIKSNEQVDRINDVNKRIGIVESRLDALRKQLDPTQLPTAFQNGLDAQDRHEFYHLPEGSELYPLEWLRVLEDSSTGKPFLDDLERFGFLADPENPDKLPVGLTAAVTRGLEPLGKMVGLNCAACHVGELTYKGAHIRIDGAPNQFNARLFFASLVESALATAEDPAKLVAFVGRLRDERSDQKTDSRIRQAARSLVRKLVVSELELLEDALAPVIKRIIDQEKTGKPVAFDKLLAEVKSDGSGFRSSLLKGFDSGDLKPIFEKSTLLKKSLEYLDKQADREGTLVHALEEIVISVRLLRSRAEFLKRLGPVGKDERTDWGPGRVDAFGSARTFLFDPEYRPRFGISYPHLWGMGNFSWFHYDANTTSILQRNFGQALGVGAVYDPETFASTLRPLDLHKLETLARKITPPAWPEKLFGKIDPDSVKRGAELFKTHCSKCHPTLKDGELTPDLLFDPKEVGTDPIRAISFAAPLPKAAGVYTGMPLDHAIEKAMAKITEKALAELTPAERAVFDKDAKPKWRAPQKYVGRPLLSSWATAPYLHNGSVPTLYDLLLPAKDRPKQFYLGSREFDPVKLGYVTTAQARSFLFDTTKEGNSNAGHEYGTSLKAEQRADLLEYLKAN